MNMIDNVKEWLWSIALKKGVVSAAKLIVAWALAKGIAFSGTIAGITIDLSSVAAMTVAINSGLTVLRNFLKVKFPKAFGWL